MASFDYSHAPAHLIRRAHQLSVALFAEETATHDVTPVQFAILQALLDAPGADQVTIAQRVALDAATSGSVMGRLETRGWLERSPDAADKRRRRLTLTPEGRKAAHALKKPAQRVQERLLERLSTNEQEQLVRLLSKLSQDA
jgi:DNA-binding MarR family transcriptional regulator